MMPQIKQLLEVCNYFYKQSKHFYLTDDKRRKSHRHALPICTHYATVSSRAKVIYDDWCADLYEQRCVGLIIDFCSVR